MKNNKGFTLIELLIVIGIIAILAAAVIIAINPAQQFQQARNTARRSNLVSIANVFYSYYVTNQAWPVCDNADGDSSVVGSSDLRLNEMSGFVNVENCVNGDDDLANLFSGSSAPEPPTSGEMYEVQFTTNEQLELRSSSSEWQDNMDNIFQ